MKPDKIHSNIFFNYEGQWICTVDGQRKVYSSPFEILDAYRVTIDSQWKRYYDDCISHITHMEKKKGTVSESEWQMQHSCMAPNKPGYEYANNH